MIDGITGSSLSSITLEMFLNLKLAKEIGLKRSTESTLEVFGMRIKVLEL